ncbi:hypothetical protein GN956_G25365 [Arapaima gigas]
MDVTVIVWESHFTASTISNPNFDFPGIYEDRVRSFAEQLKTDFYHIDLRLSRSRKTDSSTKANMEVAVYNSFGAESIVEMLPSAQKTALLFHQSYLCMANFPELERLIRSRATDSQQLFSSSAALLLQCVSTSDNMVNTLIPMLKKAIEKNKPVLAVKYLEKARRWIEDVIDRVDETVKKYEKLDKEVGSTASDVISTKIQTEAKKTETNKEAKSVTEEMKKVEERLKNMRTKVEKVERDIENEQSKLEKLVQDIASRNRKFGIAAAVVPIIGWLVDTCQKLINEPGDNAAIQTLKMKLKQLGQEKQLLVQEEWKLESDMRPVRMELSKLNKTLGTIPDTGDLNEVQKCLSRIQQMLLKLKAFWEGVGVMLENLQQKTFAGEDMLEDLEEWKDDIITSLDSAQRAWGNFGVACLKVRGAFSIQSKDAYKFLEVNPSSLSEEEWQKQYDDVQKQLDALYESPPPAIKQNPPEAPVIVEQE